ncbi:MAG: SH3 domain-containing protein [Blastochloris sp.]|nr:SH3 domain-containing protein [Blastochloris sp.]
MSIKAGWRTRVLLGVLLMLIVFTTTWAQQPAEFGVGWTATYFNNTDLSGSPVFTEALAGGINFNFGAGSPNAAVNTDNFSARYDSTQNFNAGTYEFVISSDDGARVFIDDVSVFNQFGGRVLTTNRFQQTFPTAGPRRLRVEWADFVGDAIIQFQWFQVNAGQPTGIAPGGTPGLATPFGTPPDFALTPQATVYFGPVAQVTGARGLALRTGPYLGTSFITVLTPDNTYPVLARNFDEGIYNWYLLQVGERQGWASGRYLTISVPVETIPLAGSVFDQIDDTGEIGAVAITRAVMNLRSRPSVRSPQIGSIPWGATTALIGRTVQAGENRWYHVRYNGQVGWIAAPWITIRGELFQVPVR